MNTINATPFTIHHSSMLMIFLPTCPWLSSPHQVFLYNNGGLGISFGVIMANATSWIIETRQFFPQFRGNSSTQTYDVHKSAVGLPQERRMESPVRMKALYAASVNGSGQGTEW